MGTYSFFFFNYKATTGIYTDCNTRSLHDALPIWMGLSSAGGTSWFWLVRVSSTKPNSPACARYRPVRSDTPVDAPRMRASTVTSPSLNSRSEEHTSELQSLMRNSYAVLCLKKTKKLKPTHTTRYSHPNQTT